MNKRYLLIPVFTTAWVLHGLSEWSYSAAEWLYAKCGMSMIEANIKWQEPSND